jgi:Tfp pilus assembly protein PilF
LLARANVDLPQMKETPESPHHFTSLGAQQLRLGNGKEAVPYFERALALNPRLQHACIGLVRGRAMAGEYDAAYAAADRCNAAIPSLAETDGLRRLIEALRANPAPKNLGSTSVQ